MTKISEGQFKKVYEIFKILRFFQDFRDFTKNFEIYRDLSDFYRDFYRFLSEGYEIFWSDLPLDKLYVENLKIYELN